MPILYAWLSFFFVVIFKLSDFFMNIIFYNSVSCLLRGSLQKYYNFVVMPLEIQEQVVLSVYLSIYRKKMLCLIYLFCKYGWKKKKE